MPWPWSENSFGFVFSTSSYPTYSVRWFAATRGGADIDSLPAAALALAALMIAVRVVAVVAGGAHHSCYIIVVFLSPKPKVVLNLCFFKSGDRLTGKTNSTEKARTPQK